MLNLRKWFQENAQAKLPEWLTSGKSEIYDFTPQDDITAKELAFILKGITHWNPRDIYFPKPLPEKVKWVMRHFTKVS